MVFVNFDEDEITDFIKYIKDMPDSIKSLNTDMKYDFSEEYILIEDETASEEDLGLGFDSYIVKKVEGYYFDIIALVIAKSVALEPIESRISAVIDETEPIIASLKKGKLKAKDKKLTSLIGSILAFRHTTISYIQLLDKPDVTWKSENAELLFNDLADNFELTDRNNIINSKTDALLSTTEVFANLTYSKRANNLDLIVVILILIELIFMDPSLFNPIFRFFARLF